MQVIHSVKHVCGRSLLEHYIGIKLASITTMIIDPRISATPGSIDPPLVMFMSIATNIIATSRHMLDTGVKCPRLFLNNLFNILTLY